MDVRQVVIFGIVSVITAVVLIAVSGPREEIGNRLRHKRALWIVIPAIATAGYAVGLLLRPS